jgi:hypothetical protein
MALMFEECRLGKDLLVRGREVHQGGHEAVLGDLQFGHGEFFAGGLDDLLHQPM